VTSGGIQSRRACRLVAALLLPALLAGCAASSAYKKGRNAMESGDWDQAVLAFTHATAIAPDVQKYKQLLWKSRLKASEVHFEKAKRYLAVDQLEPAIGELQQTTYLDPANQHAQVELEKAMLEWHAGATRSRRPRWSWRRSAPSRSAACPS